MDTYSSFSGTVIHGSKTGRTMGFPTLNIAVSQGEIPEDGVYIVKSFINNIPYFGIMSIGNRPTFTNDETKTVEVHLLDVSDDFYNTQVEVKSLCFVRRNKKFNSINELKLQIQRDKDFAEDFIKQI